MLLDKLDEMNRKKNIHKNLIKWWDINMLPAENTEDDLTALDDSVKDSLGDSLYDASSEDYITIDELDDASKDVVSNILVQNDRSHVDNVISDVENENKQKEADNNSIANEIYERLMREAAEDEAKKQQEIEMAKLAATNG